MANRIVGNGPPGSTAGSPQYTKADGTGTDIDPFIDHVVLEDSDNVTFTISNELLGAVDETAPATDTASSGLNGRLQRIAQRLTSLLLPAASGGYSTARIAAANTTNATSVKASAGQVYGWYLFNKSAAVVYVKLYNKASAPDETDTPIVTIGLPIGGGSNIVWAAGTPFATGIAYRIVTGVADDDVAAPALNDVHGWLLYK